VVTLDEADSPRGRVHLMKAVVEGRIEAGEKVFEHLDRCLVCRACETACPSGVVYHELIEAVRPQVAEAVLGKNKRMRSGVLQWMVTHVLPYPKRAGLAMLPLKVARKVGLGGLAMRVAKWMPGAMRGMAEAAPEGGSGDVPMFTPAAGELRGRVVLLRGCVGSVVSGAVNEACAKVMAANGFDVHLLASEPCCGAMAAHANDVAGAHEWAMALVDALLAKGGDYFVSPIAGCGAQLKALDHVLADSPRYAEKARDVVRRMRDVTEFLTEVGLRSPPGKVRSRTVAYHDPCHLVHAQRISEQPRSLLAQVAGLTIVPLAESDMCCGAAGTYNLSQPGMAEKLGQRKVLNIVATGATELVTANIGCALQIQRHLKAAGHDVAVKHVVEVLAEGYGRGKRSANT
jgi:glycolate oxidase iron-sulfur subunit